MMSIPRTVSSKISICKRMKVRGEHPFTFPPHFTSLIEHLLLSLFKTSMPNSLRKEMCICTSPLPMQPRAKLDRQQAGRDGLLQAHPWAPTPAGPLTACTASPQLPGIFYWTEQGAAHLLHLYSWKCLLFSDCKGTLGAKL